MNPENDIPLTQLKKFSLYLLKSPIQSALDYFQNSKSVSCIKHKYSCEYFFDVMETLYPINIYDNAVPICYGFSPVKYHTISVFFMPLYDGVSVVPRVSEYLTLPYYALRYDNSNAKCYMCELSEYNDSNLLRMIRVMYDGRNTFFQSGNPYTFENIDNYSINRIKKRFTLLNAIDYLAQLGFPLDDTGFWNPVDYLYCWKDEFIIKWLNNNCSARFQDAIQTPGNKDSIERLKDSR